MSTAKKYVNPLSDHWWSNPLNFRQHPSAPKAATGTNIRRAAAGSCSLPTVLKSCRELLQKGSRKRRPKTHYFIRLSYGPKLSPLPQAEIDDRAPFFSRRIRWTPPSFQWHNPVSAWLSIRVRASDYRWCPNIDNFLYSTAPEVASNGYIAIVLALPVNNTKPSKKMPNPFSALAVIEESNKSR